MKRFVSLGRMASLKSDCENQLSLRMGTLTRFAGWNFFGRFRLWLRLYRLGLRRGSFFFVGLLAFGNAFCAVEDPLAVDEPVAHEDSVRQIWQVRAADRALKMGFSSLAAAGYRELLETVPAEDSRRDELLLSLATALISDGKSAEAAAVLERRNDREAPAYQLRRAALDWQAHRWKELGERLEALDVDSLPDEERGWYFFLQGLAADRKGQKEVADEAFSQAFELAISPHQQAAFILGQHRARLFSGEANEELAVKLKGQMEEFSGQTTGLRFAQQYAIVLNEIGQKEEAVKVIREQIQRISSAEKELRDQFLLLDGLISGAGSGHGRESMRELLETGSSRRLQRIALQQLAGSVTDENSLFISGLLSRLIEAGHPLVEELHLYRAQLTLRETDKAVSAEDQASSFEQATVDAETILTQYPGSRLKVEALEVLAASAWEQRRYRTAANHLTKLREELPMAQRRGEVGLLIADSYFRAGEVNRAVEDYRNAADAYGTVLREHPDSISPGLVFYQRILAEIRGNRMEDARRQLDEISEGLAIEPAFRWQAEWNFVKAMQRGGQMEQAYERVKALLSEESSNGIILDELRVRFAWLEAQLSFDAGQPEKTIPLAEAVMARVGEEPSPVDEPVRSRIISYSLLLRGQAQLAVGEAAAALMAFKEIRERFPETDPAIYSILVEARYYTQVNRTVDAQQLLTSLADAHKESQYAPIALYEAALNAQRRGQESSYQDQAIALLERLVAEYPGHELAFYARLDQGDLLRRLNRFEAAEMVYLSIENNFADHPDIFLAQLSLADSYLAQAGKNGKQKFENGVAILERLFDLPVVAVDVRAEAGFKLAFANARHDREDRAQQIYWAAVSNLYLNEASSSQLGSRGRYWIARCLLEYGQQFEREGRLEEARKAYALIAEGGLPGDSLAAANLARLMPKEHLQ